MSSIKTFTVFGDRVDVFVDSSLMIVITPGAFE
jgi:hypothetical protein